MTNDLKSSLIVCDEHISSHKQIEILGQGRCESHGKISIFFKNLKVPCKKCAYIRAVCQVCGKLLTKDNLDLWHKQQNPEIPKGKSRVYL